MVRTWTPALDAALIAMRAAGMSWRAIGRAFDGSQHVMNRRGRVLGLSPARLNSGPMPGTAIAAGQKPHPSRFTEPSMRARLGRKWRTDDPATRQIITHTGPQLCATPPAATGARRERNRRLPPLFD